MTEKICKNCSVKFTPLKFANNKSKCRDCFFEEQKEKLCKYHQRQLSKPKKEYKKQTAPKRNTEQEKINAQVRERDEGKSCICCGIEGVKLQAGHYIAVSKCENLRYNLDNIHGQCQKCNCDRVGDPKITELFRKGLMKRIGEKRVLALEEKNRSKKDISNLKL